ncbi:MAG: oligopeptide transporter, OPT family [Gammaproteobacteria bacterium GWE2_42_36]|nr:MAG: oligopeptide transporter, OPT family [Gammaproteobacteria bacterium GWE2_42_36]HCU05287.1 oligopeptide transporter, OPT family [Coxiellaceae bacterium]
MFTLENNKNAQMTSAVPELTPKAIILSVIIAVFLGASNAYLGLKVGTTVAASIPALVITMAIFRFFPKHNILEANIVQCASCAGSGVAAVIIFTMPALIIMHYWTKFNYWETAFIAAVGSIIGVLFSGLIRRQLIHDKTLPFPEGIAIGEVMKASADSERSLKPMMLGGFSGAIIQLCQSGFCVFSQALSVWAIQGTSILGMGIGFSPAVIAAGYICGINVAISMFIGVILGWVLGIPLLSHHYGFTAGLSATESAKEIWSNYVRYIGVGTMLVGGMWTLIKLIGPMGKAMVASTRVFKEKGHILDRTEYDIPFSITLKWTLFLSLMIFVFLMFMFHPSDLGISLPLYLFILAVCVLYLIVAGFIFSSLAGYFNGFVGSTNCPASGLMASALLGITALLLVILVPHINFAIHVDKGLATAALTIVVVAFGGSIMIMAGETVQVAKAGRMVGGTPWKQQVVLFISIIAVALVLPLILQLLFNAYGIGGVYPRPGMSQLQTLSAPQAGLMAAVSQAVFNHQIPWNMLGIGALIAIAAIINNELLYRLFKTRWPVLAIGLGIYLSLDATTPMIIGGIVSYLVNRKVASRYRALNKPIDENHLTNGMQNAIMLACGIVAGSTLMGVLVAIPFAIKQSTDVLRIVSDRFTPEASALSVVITLLLCFWIYRSGTQKDHKDAVI